MSQSPSPEVCPPERLSSALEIIEGDGPAGLAALEGLLGDYPGDPKLHFLRGSVLAGLGRFDDARDAIGRAVVIAPAFDIARFQLGLLELTSGDPARAAETWAAFQALPQDDALRLFSEGLLHMAQDGFVLAQEKITAGLARNHENPALNSDMQMVLDAIGEQAQSGSAVEDISAAHLLLQQYSGKTTRH